MDCFHTLVLGEIRFEARHAWTGAKPSRSKTGFDFRDFFFLDIRRGKSQKVGSVRELET
jgi:hypothetical protein